MSRAEQLLSMSTKPHAPWRRDDCLYDLVFFLSVRSRGSIREQACRMIERECGLHCGWVFAERDDRLSEPLPKAYGYFFADYQLAISVLAQYAEPWRAKRFVHFIDPDVDPALTPPDLLPALQSMHQVFCMNAARREFLKALGVNEQQIKVAVGGADPEVFRPAQQAGTKVGFVGAYYDRQNPDLMLEVIRARPDQEFLLIAPSREEIVSEGAHWQNYRKFDELMGLPNFSMVESRYENYPEAYRKLKAYVSLSSHEDDPCSMLEAMLSAVYPIVTDTGVARDVIAADDHGRILPLNSSGATVLEALQRLPASSTALRKRAEQFSWPSFGKLVTRHMGMSLIGEQTLAFVEGGLNADFVEGWWPPEVRGVWASRIRSQLYFVLSSALTGEAFRLTFGLVTLPGVRRLVTVAVAGDVEHAIVVEGDMPQPAVIEVPAWLSAHGCLTVRFVSDGLAAPKALGINDDERMLGFKLSHMVVG